MPRRLAPSRDPVPARVTVVIPCYNYGHYLPEAVASALTQSGVAVDVIIVDDCSVDGSAEVADRLAVDHPAVSVIHHPVNRGHIRTYNDGLAAARGDFVVLLSADDLLAPGSLQRSTSLMQAHPSVGLVYGYAPAFETTPGQERERPESWTVWEGRQWIRQMCRRGHNIIVNPEAILRRSVMNALVGYREDMPQAADMELWLRAAAITDVGRVNGPVQAYYRVHGGNMHQTRLQGIVREVEARRGVFLSIAELTALTPDLRASLVATAMRSLSREAVREAARVGSVREADGESVSDQLLRLAMECDPAVRHTVAWQLARWRRDDNLPSFASRGQDLANRLVWSLRWRRWRRYGT